MATNQLATSSKQRAVDPPAAKHTLSEESARVLTTYHRVKQQYEPFLHCREGEILTLIDLLDKTRGRWKTAENLQMAAEERSDRLERARTNLETQVKTKQNECLTLQEEVLGLRNVRQVLEEQISEYECRLGSLRSTVEENLKNTAGYEKMMKLSRMSRPMPPIHESRRSRHVAVAAAHQREEPGQCMDDTSSLNTEEDEVHLRYNRVYRRSQSQEPEARHQRVSQTKRTRTSRYDAIEEERENDDPRVHPPSAKRSREQCESKIMIDTTITVDPHGRHPTRASVEVRRSGKKRSVSASRILDDKPNTARRQLVVRAPRLIAGLSSSDLRKTPKTLTAFGSSWTQGRPIHECTHKFIPLTMSFLQTLMKNCCAYCTKSFSTRAKGFTCEHCQMNVHEHCKLRAPMPCLPVGVFPKDPVEFKTKKNLADLCPVLPPFIPKLVIRCIYTLEHEPNRITTSGLYRVCGDKTKQNELFKDLMQNKFFTDMSLPETEVVCGTIKQFLRSLKDPLIPRSSYQEFVRAAAIAKVDDRQTRLCEMICDLPLPNQDTLAYLCSHLQKVAAHSQANLMPAENLAMIFAPTLLQHYNSTLDALGGPEAEVQKQIAVVEALLEMPRVFWTEYLEKRTASTAPTTFGQTTPKTHHRHNIFNKSTERSALRGVDHSVLGPVSYAPSSDFTPRSRTPGRIPGGLC